MNLILSADLDWGIGRGNELLLRIPEDMKFFRKMTVGKVIVMGRKTLESLPGMRPLPERTNIVLSKSGANQEGIISCGGTDGLFRALKAFKTEDVFIIGGEMIYRLLMPYCDTAYITKIRGKFPADSHVPDFDSEDGWICAEKLFEGEYNGISYERFKYKNTSISRAD